MDGGTEEELDCAGRRLPQSSPYPRSRGRRVLRLRGERLERPFAHLYETGGMRRVHLRGHTNIRKRLLIHAGGFNLGLLMRQLIDVGSPPRAARAAHRAFTTGC